jgi:hypothetical protein
VKIHEAKKDTGSVFADTRAFAEDWTYRFLATAIADATAQGLTKPSRGAELPSVPRLGVPLSRQGFRAPHRHGSGREIHVGAAKGLGSRLDENGTRFGTR